MTETTTIDWQGVAGRLRPRSQAVIGGCLVDAADGGTFPATSPSDGTVLADIAACRAVDVDRAVTEARAVFDDGHWSRTAPAERRRVILRLAALIEEHADELALAVSLEMGKPLADAHGSVWTRDLITAHRAACSIRAGTVWVNCFEEGGLSVPFGGMKQSGNGRDKSLHAIDKYVDLKTTWITL